MTAAFKPHVGIPVVTSNRINLPQVAEEVLARGDADLVSMARPFLADPDWVLKATTDRADEINVCIACNQACLDHVFAKQKASCMVNPRAARETELRLLPTRRTKNIAVVGAGPAGLAAAVTAAERGHRVELFEADEEIGGQFGIARRIPGKEEFAETIRYYRRRLELTGVKLHLGRRATAEDLRRLRRDRARDRRRTAHAGDPRHRSPEGPLVRRGRPGGQARRGDGRGDRRRAGSAWMSSEFLTTEASPALDLAAWKAEWGVADPTVARGALTEAAARSRRRGRCTCCSASPGRSAPASARPPAGCTAPR